MIKKQNFRTAKNSLTILSMLREKTRKSILTTHGLNCFWILFGKIKTYPQCESCHTDFLKIILIKNAIKSTKHLSVPPNGPMNGKNFSCITAGKRF
jgi:hypothetical protein